MTSHVDRIAQRLRDAEDEVHSEVEEQKRRWRYRVHRGRVGFDHDVRMAHERLRQSLPAYLRSANVFSLLTAPVIYSLLVPLAVLDLWIWAYQWVCFPLYGIARVRRGPFFALDRHTLAYLNAIEKVNCTFCAYANGVLAYVREIAARTELYWCPIKHSRAIPAPHMRYHRFLDYGDAEGYHRDLPALRDTLRNPADDTAPGGATRGDDDHPH